jgi:hypothetical protein
MYELNFVPHLRCVLTLATAADWSDGVVDLPPPVLAIRADRLPVAADAY